MGYMADKQGVIMLKKSAFNRRLHRLATTLSVLFYYLADFFKTLNLSSEYLIDSFPVAVCNTVRIGHSGVVKGEELPLNGDSFFGFRAQLITTRQKQPVQFFILPGSYVNITALQMMHLDLPVGSEVFGDTGYEQEELYADREVITLGIQRSSNSSRPDLPWEAAYKKGLR